MSVHPTAIVAEGAVVPASCTVGPFCTVGPNVVLGEECELVSHVVLDGHTTLGARNKVYSFACLGIAPQDLKYAGEPTGVTFGDDNTIREYVTISRGTAGGGGVTRVGSGCLIMAYVHIGHDSSIGQRVHSGERGDAGGACDGGGLCERGCAVPGASVLPHWEVQLHWRRDDDYAGCAAVLADERRAE